MLRLTREMIFAGASSAGGWNRPQLALIGVPWPPVKGWVSARIGSQIDEQSYCKFLALKGAKKRKCRDTETLELFGNAPETASNTPPNPDRDQAARDYANALWEQDAANFDAVPQRAVNTGKDWQEL